MLERLKLLRDEFSISQRELAEAAGVSQQSINKYENHNIEPDISTLIRIADYFNVSVDYIIGHSDERRPVALTPPHELSETEKILLNNYRAMSARKQQSILEITEFYKEP